MLLPAVLPLELLPLEFRSRGTTLSHSRVMKVFGSLALIFVLLLVLAGFVVAQTRPEFLDGGSYTGLPGGLVMGVGDFNGDGQLDFVEVGRGVLTLLGNGDGTFQKGKTSPMTQTPNAVGVGDFNHDGKQDLVTTDFQNNVSVLLGNGDGSFQPWINYPAGAKPISVTVADFNGDGNLDLAVVDSKQKVVNVLLGNADGSFQSPMAIAAGNLPLSVTAADLNGDHKADLIVLNDSIARGTASVILGNGNGTFQAPVAYTVGKRPVRTVVADFNGDSKMDIAVANGSDNTCIVLLGNGDGTFQPQSPTTVATNPSDMVAGDFNGDHNLDLIIQQQSAVSLLLGNGDGTFQASKLYGAGPLNYSIASGRFNQDATDDVAVVGAQYYDSTDNIFVLLGNRDGTLRTRPAFWLGKYNSGSAVVGDLNQDGKLDVVSIDGFENLCVVLMGNGDGSFAPHADYPTGGYATSLALADMNNDGKQDVVTANGGSISVLLGNGDGSLGSPHDTASTGNLAVKIAVGDLNHDGLLDVVESTNSQQGGAVLMFLGNGDGSLQTLQTVATASIPIPDLAIADVNGDGKGDLLVLAGALRVYLGNGDGTFQAPVDYATGGSYPISLKVVDFNHDGALDAVTSNIANSVSVLFGNGNGTFRTHIDSITSATPIAPPISIEVADFNGDSKLDVAVAESDTTGGGEFVGVLLGNGDGTLKPEVEYESGYQPTSIAAGDFNGDGAPDLAADAIVLNLLMNTGGTKLVLQSSNNPSHLGGSVTFTVSVKASFPGVGSPNGKVRFEDGKTILGTVALTNGVAQFTLSTLAVGNHRIDAVYEGSATFNPHKSSVLVQQVLP
jgi:hypothetical protein